MTRKITKEAVAAFIAGCDFHKSNTSVEVYKDGTAVMSLFGNPITCKRPDGSVEVSDAGYPTVTTKECLNGLMGALDVGGVYQKDGQWYFDDGTPFECDEWQLVKTA